MKVTKFFSAFPISLILITTTALSSDQAWFRMLGFSEDGEYAAWEMGGIQDGSGFQWIELEILDTGSSAQVERYRYVWDELVDELPDEEDVASIDLEILDICREYGIQPGSYESPLVLHPMTDLGVSGDSVAFCLESYTPNYNSGEILMILSLLTAEIEQGYPEWFPPPAMPVLHVVEDGATALFFSGKLVQERFSLDFSYSIAAVYRNPVVCNSLLVVLHSIRPGFEGPDGRFRVVSGGI
ncbi:MAG: hypothetical protein KAH54_08700 [Candidatus Sabulitectum sp.]|nr:hypothetical protein [Candidatus Sabulitectum sp.]